MDPMGLTKNVQRTYQVEFFVSKSVSTNSFFRIFSVVVSIVAFSHCLTTISFGMYGSINVPSKQSPILTPNHQEAKTLSLASCMKNNRKDRGFSKSFVFNYEDKI